MESLPYSLKVVTEGMVRNNPDAMVTVIDQNDTFLYASPSATKLFGHAPTDIVEHPASDFFGRQDIVQLRLIVRGAIQSAQSATTSRSVKLKFGGTKCMSGPAYGYVDVQTRQGYAIAIGQPCAENNLMSKEG